MDGVKVALSSRARENGGGCTTIHEREEGVESPNAYVDD